jgi:hypothetical protein
VKGRNMLLTIEKIMVTPYFKTLLKKNKEKLEY